MNSKCVVSPGREPIRTTLNATQVTTDQKVGEPLTAAVTATPTNTTGADLSTLSRIARPGGHDPWPARADKEAVAGSQPGSHPGGQLPRLADANEHRAEMRPRLRTGLNVDEQPLRYLRIRRLGVRVLPSAFIAAPNPQVRVLISCVRRGPVGCQGSAVSHFLAGALGDLVDLGRAARPWCWSSSLAWT